MKRLWQWLRDIFTAFRKGGGTKFKSGRPVGRPGSRGTRTKRRGSGTRCVECGLFRRPCADATEPCGVCVECCPGHDEDDHQRDR